MKLEKNQLLFINKAVQFQHGWAYANDVNLLAANANQLQVAGTGSGIYAGKRGSVMEFIASGPTTKVIIADVPIHAPTNNQINEDMYHKYVTQEPLTVLDINTDYNLLKENLSSYTIHFLNISGEQSGELHSNETNCNYTVSIADMGQQEDKVQS